MTETTRELPYMAQLPELIPREVIFGNPEKASPQLSPDGARLAYIAPVDGVLNVWVGPVGGTAEPVTRDTERGIRVYFWAHDGRHLLYLQDRGGDENWRVFKVDPETRGTDDLTPFDKVQAQIIALEKHRPHEILIGLNRDDERLHDVYHLDLRTNALSRVAANPGDVIGWVADRAFAVRAAVATTDDGGTRLLVRDTMEADWRTAVEWSPEDSLTSGPHGFTADGRALYLIDSRSSNTGRLVRYELDTGASSLLASDPRYDIGDIVIHPDTREVQLVSFIRARQEWTVLDETVRADVDGIRALSPGDFDIVDRTHRDDRWIVAFTEDAQSTSWWTWDRTARRGELLFEARPELANYALARMTPIAFNARDGLPIEGYLTLPPGVEPRRLPAVLNVHGGPWHRDVWGYDPEAQWLANRGYAVIQVNFRGSTGYGKDFLNAGNKQWGAKMHDDLVDAVRWAVDEGIADRERVAIYGGSYGGYAALAGATFTPELFRCAVSIVGPSNLITFIETIPPYWSTFLHMLHERVGDPATEQDMLVARSPLTHVDRIRIPMLIAQGANDPRVKRAESEQIVAAMRDKHIPHEYLLFEDEGHGFAKPANRLRFYAAAERFLAEHLGGRVEAEPPRT